MNPNRQGQEEATISSYKRVRYENYDNYYEDIPRGIAPYYNTPYAEVYRESYRLAAQHDTLDSKESMTFQERYRPTTQNTMNMKHEESIDFTATGAGHHEMMQALPVNPTISSATMNKVGSTNKPAEGRKVYRANLKLDTLVRAQMIQVGDELRWTNNSDIKCKIIVRSIATSHNLNLTVTYQSIPGQPIVGPSSNTAHLHQYENTKLSTQNYDAVQGPTRIEDAIRAHCGISGPKSKGWYGGGSWSSFAVYRNGVNMGTLTELRLQLVDDLNSGNASLQGRSGKKRGSMLGHLRVGETGSHEGLGDLGHSFDEVVAERDAALEVARRLYALVEEVMGPGFNTPMGGSYVRERMREIEMVTEGKAGLWEKVVQQEEVFYEENGAVD